MNQKLIKNVLVPFLVLALFAGFFPGKDDKYFEISKNIDLFTKIYKEISFNYVDDINPEQFIRSGIKGMLGSLDPYTVFMDENKKDEIDLITNGKYGGIGVSIGLRGEDVTIVEVMDGYTAQRQGIKVGDVLVDISGVKITPENLDDISSLVKGEPGSTVDLTVVRNEKKDTVDFNLLREEIVVKNLAYYGFVPENSNNVYMKLTTFSRSAADEIKKAIKELKAQKEITSFVFDLRGNPGGLLDVAVDITNKFVSKDKLIVSTKGKEESSEKKYYATQEPLLKDCKLVVLINDGSASASEIVAGAIQDHDRGVILGTRSYGKGLVQTITPLNYNTSLKITTAKYYTPSGRCIQKVNYSNNNKVFAHVDSLIESEFLTSNKRKVYSAGGITPDSMVEFDIQGNITKEYLAHGMFFKFADRFYYNNTKLSFSNINDSKLLSEYEKYVADEKFIYTSEAEKEIDKLIADSDKKKLENAELKRIRKQLEKVDNDEYKIYKNEILREMKEELASRFLGSKGRITEALKGDTQFQTAIKLLADESKYNELLKNH